MGQVILTVLLRVHATHEYSGFGKAFEQKFKWEMTQDNDKGGFIKCSNTCQC